MQDSLPQGSAENELRQAVRHIRNMGTESHFVRRDILHFISSLIIPLVLGVFTIITTFHQQKLAREQRLEDLNEARHQREQEEHGKRYLANTQYQDELLMIYIRDMAVLLEKYNGTLIQDKTIATIVRAKTLNIFRQLDAQRSVSIIRFLYEAGQLNSMGEYSSLDLSTAEFHNIDFRESAVNKKKLHFLALANAFFWNATFSDLDMQQNNFAYSEFQAVNFSLSHLANMNFLGAFIHNGNFSSAILVGISFAYTRLENLDFSNATLRTVNFTTSDLKHVNYLWIQLSDSTLSQCEVENSTFSYAKIRQTAFTFAHFINTSFTFASFSGISFVGCVFRQVDFSFCQMLDIEGTLQIAEHVKFSNAFISNWNLGYNGFSNIDFSKSRLVKINMKGSMMQHINFFGAELISSDLAAATCHVVNFSNAVFVSADFKRIIAVGAHFQKITGVSISFDKANLSSANFQGSNLKYASFSGANLTNTNFVAANLYKANFNGTTITDDQLRSALSIQDALLPNGTFGQDANLIENGEANCNTPVNKNWVLKSGDISTTMFDANTTDCRFSLQSHHTGASMFQQISLLHKWDSVAWPKSEVVLTAKMSLNVSIMLRALDNIKITLAEAILDVSKDSVGIILKDTMMELEVLVSFNSFFNGSMTDSAWCDNIKLFIIYGTNREQSLENIFPLRAPSTLKLNINTKWQQTGITVAGGNGKGPGLNQLNYPYGLYIDDDKTIYVSDQYNSRIMEWKPNAKFGRVVAGGNGVGNGAHQLSNPLDVIVDRDRDHLIVCDSGNKRVVQWPRRNGATGEIIIRNVTCAGLTLDQQGSLYVIDTGMNAVKRYEMGNLKEKIVAGGNGRGNFTSQLDAPQFAFVDEKYSVYVSEHRNNRIVKWVAGSEQGTIEVFGEGNDAVDYPWFSGLLVDQMGTIYVSEILKNRVVRWPQQSAKGSLVVGGNGEGEQANQLIEPVGLSFDLHGNLYVVDRGNDRVQKFLIDTSQQE